MSSIMVNLLEPRLRMKKVRVWGTWASVSTRPKMVAVATRMRIAAEETVDSAKRSKSSLGFTVFSTRVETMMEYTQATAPASVGVNLPE